MLFAFGSCNNGKVQQCQTAVLFVWLSHYGQWMIYHHYLVYDSKLDSNKESWFRTEHPYSEQYLYAPKILTMKMDPSTLKYVVELWLQKGAEFLSSWWLQLELKLFSNSQRALMISRALPMPLAEKISFPSYTIRRK